MPGGRRVTTRWSWRFPWRIARGRIHAAACDPPKVRWLCARCCGPRRSSRAPPSRESRKADALRPARCGKPGAPRDTALPASPVRNSRRTADLTRVAPVRARRPAVLPRTLGAPSHSGLALPPSPSRSPLANRKLLRSERYIPLGLRFSDCSQRWITFLCRGAFSLRLVRSALIQTAQYPDIRAALLDSENFGGVKMSVRNFLKSAAARTLTILRKLPFG